MGGMFVCRAYAAGGIVLTSTGIALVLPDWPPDLPASRISVRI